MKWFVQLCPASMGIANAMRTISAASGCAVVFPGSPHWLYVMLPPMAGARPSCSGRDFFWCNNYRLPVFGDDEGAIAPVASSPSHRSARRVVKDEVAIALHDRLYCATAMRVCRPDCSPRAVCSVNDEISVTLHDGDIAPVFRVHTFSGHQALTWHRESMSLKVRSTIQLVRFVGAQLPKRCPLRCERFRR